MATQWQINGVFAPGQSIAFAIDFTATKLGTENAALTIAWSDYDHAGASLGFSFSTDLRATVVGNVRMLVRSVMS